MVDAKALTVVVFSLFLIGRNIVLRKSNAVNDDWLINIGRREPNRLSLIQCHGDHVTPHGMRELFRQCSESLQVG